MNSAPCSRSNSRGESGRTEPPGLPTVAVEALSPTTPARPSPSALRSSTIAHQVFWSLDNCKRLTSLPGGTGNYYSTLQELRIEYCPALNMKQIYKCLHRYSKLEVKELSRAFLRHPFEDKSPSGAIIHSMDVTIFSLIGSISGSVTWQTSASSIQKSASLCLTSQQEEYHFPLI